MNINEYAGDYEKYQRKLDIESAENYLEKKEQYEKYIEKLEYLLTDIKDIAFGEKNNEEKIEEIKEVLKDA